MSIRRIFREIDKSLMSAVRARLSLAEVVGRHVPLQGMENEYWRGLCPFCGEGCLGVFEGLKTMGSFYHCGPHGPDLPKPDVETAKAIRETPELAGWYVKANMPAPTSRACGAHGCVVGFTMRIENIGFREALQKLCELADIPFVETEVEHEISTEAEIAARIPELDALVGRRTAPEKIAARAAKAFARLMADSTEPKATNQIRSGDQ